MDDSRVQCAGCFTLYDREEWYGWPVLEENPDFCGPCCDALDDDWAAHRPASGWPELAGEPEAEPEAEPECVAAPTVLPVDEAERLLRAEIAATGYRVGETRVVDFARQLPCVTRSCAAGTAGSAGGAGGSDRVTKPVLVVIQHNALGLVGANPDRAAVFFQGSNAVTPTLRAAVRTVCAAHGWVCKMASGVPA